MADQGKGASVRWRPSSILVAAAGPLLALVGNMATGTIGIQARWFTWATWSVTIMLVGLVIVFELSRNRGDCLSGSRDGLPVPSPLGDVSDRLASETLRYWRVQAKNRRVTTPLPAL